MDKEERIAYVYGRMMEARIELEAMLAENQCRKIYGYSPAYGYDEIISLIEKHGMHHNSLMTEILGH
jgi:hypothetical protein